METEKIFEHSLHRELWLWLAENPEKAKSQWKGWVNNGGDVPEAICDCFACEYTLDSDGDIECHNCPLIWTKNDTGDQCCTWGGLWAQWSNSDDLEECSRLARLIAELPVRDGVITR